MNPVPGTTKGPRFPSTPAPYRCPWVWLGQPETVSKPASRKGKCAGAQLTAPATSELVLCYLGNSQSAVRTGTNGKRGWADPANLNARRGALVGAGGKEGVGSAFGWSGAPDCGGGTRLRAATAAAGNRRRVSSDPRRSLPGGLQRSGGPRRSGRKQFLCQTQRCSVETEQVLGGVLWTGRGGGAGSKALPSTSAWRSASLCSFVRHLGWVRTTAPGPALCASDLWKVLPLTRTGDLGLLHTCVE